MKLCAIVTGWRRYWSGSVETGPLSSHVLNLRSDEHHHRDPADDDENKPANQHGREGASGGIATARLIAAERDRFLGGRVVLVHHISPSREYPIINMLRLVCDSANKPDAELICVGQFFCVNSIRFPSGPQPACCSCAFRRSAMQPIAAAILLVLKSKNPGRSRDFVAYT
ncbi:hypothetical protein BMI_II891 [Brucella microti CCM 4915]|uniref:Uncharacterized protein n=1 Tax=Brucella microti (strain BCCN 7-01 / CAPM 6434 / CCM 4915) TaxID=568815 RepID=C7LJ17_BRUMC|nr:hypothetical protein BMI_II891 [Brucella microti CCM 4915]